MRSMKKRSAAPKMAMKMRVMQNQAFEADIDFNSIRNQQIKVHKFEELESTSEYMETHYYKNTDTGSYLYLI